MELLQLKPLQHKGEENIALFFANTGVLNKAVRTLKNARWTRTHKCWYMPLSKENHTAIIKAFKGIATINQIELYNYLAGKKKRSPSINQSFVQEAGVKSSLPVFLSSRQEVAIPKNVKKETIYYKVQKIHPVNTHVLTAMLQQLKLKAYSTSTIKTYINEMSQLLQTINNIAAVDLTPEHLRRYLIYCYEKLKLTENTLHSRINAMKFYYEQVLGREKFFWEIPRPKKRFILPKVLGESELKRLFTSLKNKKHKAVLFTAYSAGLRVSEVVNLELKHIDRSRMQLLIKNAKGKKDRYVMLSPVLLDILTNYYITANPKPLKYVFEGPVAGTAYSSSSMQKIFQMARKDAGIHKEVSFHSLRHSFATHLLEKGIDIVYIRDILGHFDIRTTTRYLHVKKEQLVNIESPLDSLFSKEEI